MMGFTWVSELWMISCSIVLCGTFDVVDAGAEAAGEATEGVLNLEIC